ncbi:MAG: metallopeptidase TldD-related protein [Candidatus Cloacimonetes bacterium]|nr:metallopeptidase TldD-related protein [Candidatus Cloacimonadota bacterium]MDD4155783.1 metallopeptidase TldD-related protein [Candidatus Cloacimonadota bacterium]
MKEKLMTIADFLRKNVKADDYSISISYTNTHYTRFAQNSITQHMQGEYFAVYYQCIKDNKRGSASGRQMDEESLIEMLRKAETIAEQNTPDPNIEKSLEKSELIKVDNYYATIEKIDTAKLIDMVKQCIVFAKSKEAMLSGIISKEFTEHIYMTGNGFLAYDRVSNLDMSMTLRKDHIETKVSYGSKNPDTLNLDKLLNQLGSQFDALKEIKPMDYETLPVILRPQAVLNLFWFLIWLFDRQAADENLTPFTDLIGVTDKELMAFGEKFTMYSTLKDSDLMANPFTSNCVSKDISWIKNGVIENMLTSRYWAQKNNLEPSSLYNLVIAGEDTSEEEMMKMVPRGLIVNNLWYIRLNDRKSADLTGMTRDGVLYFENGKIKHAVNNFRFNEQIHNLTKRILALGKSIQINAADKVPTILFENFTFVDKTNF